MQATHEWVARVTSISGPELEVISGQLTLDSTWSPYIQGSIVVKLPPLLDPDDPDTVNPAFTGTDPQADARIYLSLSSTTIEETPVLHQAAFTLGVRTRRTNFRTNQMELTLASDEALLQDYRLFNDTSAHTYTTLYGMVYAQVNEAVTGATTTYDDAGVAATSVPSELVFPREDTIWDKISPYITGAGGRLWHDGAGTFHLDAAAPSIAENIDIRYDTNLIEAVLIEDRNGDWGDAIGIEYSDTFAWRQPTGYTKGLFLDRPQTDFVDYTEADQLLAERKKLGTQMTLLAQADYIVAPGMTVTVFVDASPTTPILSDDPIVSVTFRFPDCTMSIIGTDTA